MDGTKERLRRIKGQVDENFSFFSSCISTFVICWWLFCSCNSRGAGRIRAGSDLYYCRCSTLLTTTSCSFWELARMDAYWKGILKCLIVQWQNISLDFSCEKPERPNYEYHVFNFCWIHVKVFFLEKIWVVLLYFMKFTVTNPGGFHTLTWAAWLQSQNASWR